jgi:Flp pilus assembly protein TadG
MKNLRKLLQSKEGGAALELSIISPIFFLIIFIVFEFGAIYFTSIHMSLAVAHISDDIRGGKYTSMTPANAIIAIKADLQSGTNKLVDQNRTAVTITRETTYNGISRAEPCFDPAGTRTTGATCASIITGQPYPFRDINGNGVWDTAPKKLFSDASYTPGDIVSVNITYNKNITNPLLMPFFTGRVAKINSVIIVKNEIF